MNKAAWATASFAADVAGSALKKTLVTALTTEEGRAVLASFATGNIGAGVILAN